MAAQNHQNVSNKGYFCNTDRIVANLFTDAWHTKSHPMTDYKYSNGNNRNSNNYNCGRNNNSNVNNKHMTTIGPALRSVESYLAPKPSLSQMIRDSNNGYRLYRVHIYPSQIQCGMCH